MYHGGNQMADQIALIGTGSMGSAMAERLLGGGYPLTVYNRTKEKTEPLASKGAAVADTLQSAVEEAKIIFTSLIDDRALMDVSEAILNSGAKGFIHISTSTILPKTATHLAKTHADAGATYVASPVLGIPATLRKREATTFCAGPKQAAEQARPMLETYSKSVLNLGEEVSHANVLKVSMNYSLITAIELISELYVFAEKSGVDKSVIRENLKQIYAHPAVHVYIDKIFDRDFDEVNFDVRGGNKDVRLFQEAFLDVNVSPDIANAVQPKFNQALAEGITDKDWSFVSEIVRSRSGV